MNRIVYAPFSDNQVIALNNYQNSDHPLLCREHAWKGVLVATRAGWYCPVPGCEFIQLWAIGFQLIPGRRKIRFRERAV